MDDETEDGPRVYIVWSATEGRPLYAFTRANLMHTTALAMLGVEVISLPLHDQLPAPIREDLVVEAFSEDDVTPKTIVDVDDID